MGKKEENFMVGSLVFARIKGYPPWPAKVVKADRKKYFVYFYGTGEKSPAMKAEDLYDYTKSKAQFVVEKNLKRKHYSEAVDQIESALRGEEDVASINNTSATEESLNPVDEDLAQISQAEDSELNTKDDGGDTTNDIEMPELQPEVPKDTPSKKSSTKQTKVTPVPEPKSVKVESETSEPELVSRSGRKIKTKRYLIDELDETVTPVIKKRGVETDTNSNKPSPKVVPLKEEPNPVKDAFLQVESHLIELDHLIKVSAGLKNAEPDQCLKHLDEYKTLQITPLMLKKRPGVVHTMKRLRRYVGNTTNWEMDDNTKANFNEKAQQINLMAVEIYESFKRMFPKSDLNKSFWENFCDEVKAFKAKTKDMTVNEVNELYEEPLTPPTSPKQQHTESPQTNNGNFASSD